MGTEAHNNELVGPAAELLVHRHPRGWGGDAQNGGHHAPPVGAVCTAFSAAGALHAQVTSNSSKRPPSQSGHSCSSQLHVPLTPPAAHGHPEAEVAVPKVEGVVHYQQVGVIVGQLAEHVKTHNAQVHVAVGQLAHHI